ncbi:hypothetical protein SAMN02799622_04200 [Methylobacterium sp. UNC378MF]|uniref:Uncharacterized protein n=1 Tax=Methylobacterium oryzae TaxID=334852 RepID=A0ABU7TM69_9HYPH|nr:hypothetical protein [Methylobacterium sp. UNC378MF]SDA27988.1 hypothetical protein SAMN02799622_04200 [Methylobacterium sp. UNC378MF]
MPYPKSSIVDWDNSDYRFASPYGLVRLTLAGGAEIIPVGQSMVNMTWTVLQYLDVGDVPSNEYIIESSGSWTSVNDNALVRTSSGHPCTPACVGMNAIVVTLTDGQRLALYDLAGNFMKTTNPPGGNIPVDWTGTSWDVPSTGVDGAFFHVQSHDLIVRADGYDKIVPATFDMGMTWVNTYIPSNPNSPPPTGYVPPANGGVAAPAPVAPPAQNGNAFLVGISVWSPVFLI